MNQRSINSVSIITHYGASMGFSVTELLRNSNIDPVWLNHSEIQIQNEQELKVLENLLSLKNEPFKLGMELGGQYQLTSYGIWGYALLASPTLRKAIDLGLRYLDLTYAFCHIQLLNENQQARIAFEPKVNGAVADLVLYRDMWAMMVIQRDLFAGSFPEFTMAFTCAAPDMFDREKIMDFKSRFGGELVFGQAANFVSFDAAFLDVPLPRSNEITARICEQQCCDMLNEKRKLVGMADKVRAIILKQGLNTSMELVANELAVTSRTLHRRLADEGTSWRTLRDDVRCGMAEELLATHKLQLVEIAERLGFNDAANFSHSFKRWKGLSPSQYRSRVLASKINLSPVEVPSKMTSQNRTLLTSYFST